ncbi:MAG: hypothetical protein ACT6R2_04745 [Blastomonas fulva]|uniref:hypothetical protein n=1 Tax=Blastomonas fulva TaxID=1550728 RepID=UPI004034D0F0
MEKGTAAVVPTIAPLLANVLVALGGAVTAWNTLSARFQRVQRFETDTAGGAPSFRFFYVFAQWINGFLFVALVAVASIATVGGLMTSAAPGISIGGANTPFGQIAIGLYDLGWWVIVAGSAAGGIAVLDLIPRFFLLAGRLLSQLPIPRLEGLFGPDGRSAGWLQAREFVRASGAALPLAIDREGVDRAAQAVLDHAKVTKLAGSNRAVRPNGTDAANGNIALFACIIEQVENDFEKPRRDWDKLYEALDRLNAASHTFEPATLDAFPDGKTFYAALRAELDPILAAASQAVLPDGAIARDYVAEAFDRLKIKFQCDVVQMAERKPIPFGSKAYGLLQRARHFPKLGGDRMGPQFVKLCLRFGAVEIGDGDRLTPAFSSSIGWYLLNSDAITALQEVKSVAFRGGMNRPAVRIAEMQVLKIVADELEASITEYPDLETAVGPLGAAARRWYIEQEADTALWSTSQDALKAARTNWTGCRWKLDGLTATRI